MSELIDINGSKRCAIIIAIEDYRKSATSTISSVKYARNDANKFRDLLINDFGFHEEEIMVLADKDALKIALENDVPYHIQQLSSEFQFIFTMQDMGFTRTAITN
jgi:predicted nuclease of predicted toxin-antitoxin system